MLSSVCDDTQLITMTETKVIVQEAQALQLVGFLEITMPNIWAIASSCRQSDKNMAYRTLWVSFQWVLLATMAMGVTRTQNGWLCGAIVFLSRTRKKSWDQGWVNHASRRQPYVTRSAVLATLMKHFEMFAFSASLWLLLQLKLDVRGRNQTWWCW